MQRRNMPGCGCCTGDPPPPCACDPYPDGATITFTGPHLGTAGYQFDVAYDPMSADGKSYFSLTIPMEQSYSYSSSGLWYEKRNRYCTCSTYGATGVERLTSSTVLVYEWNHYILITMRLEIEGYVQFPVDPACTADIVLTKFRRVAVVSTNMRTPGGGFGGVNKRLKYTDRCRSIDSSTGLGWHGHRANGCTGAERTTYEESCDYELTPDPCFEGQPDCEDGVDPDVINVCDVVPSSEPSLQSVSAYTLNSRYFGGGLFQYDYQPALSYSGCPVGECDDDGTTFTIGGSFPVQAVGPVVNCDPGTTIEIDDSAIDAEGCFYVDDE